MSILSIRRRYRRQRSFQILSYLHPASDHPTHVKSTARSILLGKVALVVLRVQKRRLLPEKLRGRGAGHPLLEPEADARGADDLRDLANCFVNLERSLML